MFRIHTAMMAAAIVVSPVVSLTAEAEKLTLQRAEELALADDPTMRQVLSDGEALRELAVAAGQLPDPLLKLGVTGVPLDTFDLNQEAMTQLQLGVVQRFPRGKSRSLHSEQTSERSAEKEQLARDRTLRVVLAVREIYTDLVLQQKLVALTSEAERVFTDLAEITQDYYASGRAQQQDVLRAGVEVGRILERSNRFREAEDSSRARLAVFVDEAAYLPVIEDWPELPGLHSSADIIERLSLHPRILALQQQVLAAETGIELAMQAYKPQFALDLTYGGRSGYHPDGRHRPDLLSLMVVMDVPLFTAKRQDRVTAARIAESSSAMFGRDAVYRRMKNEADLQFAALQREKERLGLFENTLLTQAGFAADASFEAYQSSVGDLTSLMRARITEYELKLEYARLRAEMLKTQARLLYLQGDIS